jgi:hypothetical protein
VILGDKIMKIIYAPNKADFNRTTVFLAGSIEGFKSNLESLFKFKEKHPDLTLVLLMMGGFRLLGSN